MRAGCELIGSKNFIVEYLNVSFLCLKYNSDESAGQFTIASARLIGKENSLFLNRTSYIINLRVSGNFNRPHSPTLIKEYYRTLLETEKKILGKQVSEAKSQITKKYGVVIIVAVLIIGLISVGFFFHNTWVIIILSVISFFLILYSYYVISDLLRIPKFLKKKQEVIEDGLVRVTEINIDRYIKIVNLEDEGDHFIVEYDGMLSLIGGQEFLGVMKLRNKIEQIEIMDSDKTGIYYNTVKKTGKNLEPYYIFKNGISDKLIESEMWNNLTDRKPFSGKLEDLNKFIEDDKRK